MDSKTILLPLLAAISTIHCFPGALRLVPVTDFTMSTINGTVFRGRLDLYHPSDGWTPFCADNSFDLFEADIACKQLGFLYANNTGTTSGFMRDFVLRRLDCGLEDTQLFDCTMTFSLLSSCSSRSAVTLECAYSSSPVRLRSESGRTTGLSAGILEILINDKWGTVCDDIFTITEAHVACRQLGFLRANSYTNTNDLQYRDTSSSTPIWLDNVNCISSPGGSDLRLCKHRGVERGNCGHDEDVFLSCIGANSVRLSDVRTTGIGQFETSGTLEIYWNGIWGSVCYEPSFAMPAAEVACRQMGLEVVRSYGNARSLGYISPQSSGPRLILSGVVCDYLNFSSLLSILNCDHSGLGSPSPDCRDIVGISCGSSFFRPTRGTTASPSNLGTTLTFTAIAVVVTVVANVIICCGCILLSRKKRGSVRSGTSPQEVSQLNREREFPTTSSTPGDHYHVTTSFVADPSQKHDICTTPSEEPFYKESELQEAPPPSYEAAIKYPTVADKKS